MINTAKRLLRSGRKSTTFLLSTMDFWRPGSKLGSKPVVSYKSIEDLRMNVMANNQDLVRRMMRPKSGVKSANKKSSKGSLHATYFKLVAAQIDDENRVGLWLVRNCCRGCRKRRLLSGFSSWSRNIRSILGGSKRIGDRSVRWREWDHLARADLIILLKK